MSQFYLTLPSNNSMEFYPENTVANFKTRLANPISLEGDWDVALYELQYKRMWYTINYEDTHITYQLEHAILNVPQGYYNSIDEIVKTLNTLFEQFKTNSGRENAPKFGYNNRTKKIFINLNHGDRITFKPKLASILGITDNPEQTDLLRGRKRKVARR